MSRAGLGQVSHYLQHEALQRCSQHLGHAVQGQLLAGARGEQAEAPTGADAARAPPALPQGVLGGLLHHQRRHLAATGDVIDSENVARPDQGTCR